MKNLPKTIKLAVWPIAALALVFALGTVIAKDIQAPYVLKVNQARKLKKDDGGAEFEKALQAKSHIYCMKYHKEGDPSAKDKQWKKNCPDASSSASSESARSGEYTLICAGAHVTQQAGFMTQEAMQSVEDLLQ